MELKQLIKSFCYRIEPKPEGGFIARPTDPSIAPIEAATREELQQRIQAKVSETLAVEFPGLKLPLDKNVNTKISLNLNNKTVITVDTQSQKLSLGGSLPSPKDLLHLGEAKIDVSSGNATPIEKVAQSIENTPIVPEASTIGKVFRYIVVLALVAGVTYFLFLRH
jgi:hypothetical protein